MQKILKKIWMKNISTIMGESNIDQEKIDAYINDLKAQLCNIDEAVETLSQYEAYNTISDDIADLDVKIKQKNIALVSVKEEIKKIESLPAFQKVEKK